MEKMPEIKIIFLNPPKNPKNGLIIERKIGGVKYIREIRPKGFVSSTEACRILNYSLVHLYRLARWRKLIPIKKQGRLFFRVKDVLDLKLKRKKGKQEPFLR